MLQCISRIFSGFSGANNEIYLLSEIILFILKPLNERCSNVNNNGIANAFQA
jgi:hypothetical protein